MQEYLSPIAPDAISVVIQGPLYRELAPLSGILAAVASIRHHLPGAEIIVSTWEREDTSGLDGCKVVLSVEPPGFIDIAGNWINTNRQILSSRVGIEAASRKYVLKFRADHCLSGKVFASIGIYAPDLPRSRRFFTAPVTVTNLFIKNPVRSPMLFHLSDLIQFGRREDMLDLWSLPLLAEGDLFLPDGPRRNPLGGFIGFSDLREVPEQSLALGWLKRHGVAARIEHVCHVEGKMLSLWEQVLADNFRVLDWQEADVVFPARFLTLGYAVRSVYSSAEIARAGRLAGTRWYVVRRAHVWLNQYILGCFRMSWLVCVGSLLLFSLSPFLAIKVRSIWRKIRGTTHPPSGRI